MAEAGTDKPQTRCVENMCSACAGPANLSHKLPGTMQHGLRQADRPRRPMCAKRCTERTLAADGRPVGCPSCQQAKTCTTSMQMPRRHRCTPVSCQRTKVCRPTSQCATRCWMLTWTRCWYSACAGSQRSLSLRCAASAWWRWTARCLQGREPGWLLPVLAPPACCRPPALPSILADQRAPQRALSSSFAPC